MRKQIWVREEVLDHIRHLHQSGHALTRAHALEIAPKLVSAAQRHFGGWGQALEEAGIDYSSLVQDARQRAVETRTKWSKEHIVETIRNLAKKEEPLQTVVVRRTYPKLYTTACSPRYFKGWTNALEAAGVRPEPVKPGRSHERTVLLTRWRAELLLERMQQIVDVCGSTNEAVVQKVAPALYEASIRRLGSWNKVVGAIQSTGSLAD